MTMKGTFKIHIRQATLVGLAVATLAALSGRAMSFGEYATFVMIAAIYFKMIEK
ncbi:hypothetical protein ABE137_01180 [Brevibacillus laterosporus]|uniref:hypothetical protein n=1 Tax=Brevibacillus laterosporus TaxID=1465 RepID=UPI003D1F767F